MCMCVRAFLDTLLVLAIGPVSGSSLLGMNMHRACVCMCVQAFLDTLLVYASLSVNIIETCTRV